MLDRTLKTVQAGREKLRATPVVHDELEDDGVDDGLGDRGGWEDRGGREDRGAWEDVVDDRGAGQPDDGPDAFFDQDLD